MVFFLTTSYNPGFFSSFVVITEVTSPTIGKCLLMRSSKRSCLSSGRVLTRKNERELQITTTLLPIGFRIAGPYKKLGFCEKNSNIFQHFPPQLCFSLCFWHYCFATHDNLWHQLKVDQCQLSSETVHFLLLRCCPNYRIPPSIPFYKDFFFYFFQNIVHGMLWSHTLYDPNRVEIFNLYVLLILQNV